MVTRMRTITIENCDDEEDDDYKAIAYHATNHDIQADSVDSYRAPQNVMNGDLNQLTKQSRVDRMLTKHYQTTISPLTFNTFNYSRLVYLNFCIKHIIRNIIYIIKEINLRIQWSYANQTSNGHHRLLYGCIVCVIVCTCVVFALGHSTCSGCS